MTSNSVCVCMLNVRASAWGRDECQRPHAVLPTSRDTAFAERISCVNLCWISVVWRWNFAKNNWNLTFREKPWPQCVWTRNTCTTACFDVKMELLYMGTWPNICWFLTKPLYSFQYFNGKVYLNVKISIFKISIKSIAQEKVRIISFWKINFVHTASG